MLGVLLMASCKKAEQIDNASEDLQHISKPDPGANVAPSGKVNLVSLGNGVYSASWNGMSLRISGITYEAFDNNNNPIPLQDGALAWGTISVLAPNNSSVSEQPFNTIDGHFSIESSITAANGNGTVNSTGFHAAVDQVWTTYQTQHTAWVANGSTGPEPQRGTLPWISSFINHGPSSAYMQTFTGRLMRSNTGNSGFALGAESYAVPSRDIALEL